MNQSQASIVPLMGQLHASHRLLCASHGPIMCHYGLLRGLSFVANMPLWVSRVTLMCLLWASFPICLSS